MLFFITLEKYQSLLGSDFQAEALTNPAFQKYDLTLYSVAKSKKDKSKFELVPNKPIEYGGAAK